MTSAFTPGGGGKVVFDAEKTKALAIGTLPVGLQIHGPDNKPGMSEDRIIALQDKNWRLNGAFVDGPSNDPNRFDQMQEGDLALLGFDGQDWPTAVTVVLLAQSTSDVALWADLSPLVQKGVNSMVRLEMSYLQMLADQHKLGRTHVIRGLYTVPLVRSPIGRPSTASGAGALKIKKPAAVRPVSAADHKARLAANDLTGFLGEKAVNSFLTNKYLPSGTAHLWMWPLSAEHPYDFEVLAASGAVDYVIDAKATSTPWPSGFQISSGELVWAATSPVPYYIYRLSEMAPHMPSVLHISEDIRGFALIAWTAFIQVAVPGTRVTSVMVAPVASGLTWSKPIPLPPITP